jgi:peptide methionine sulfoxide reductase msrA/msrB
MKLLLLILIISTSALAATSKAYFAGGCFWCIEPFFSNLNGVSKTIVGYAGGTLKDPTYKQVSSGSTKHVEAMSVEYDPEKISFKDLVYIFFKTMDPTDNKGQFVDRGAQYRPVAFYQSESEKKAYEEQIKELDAAKVYKKAINLEITKHTTFYLAEDYHQKYFLKNPLRYKFYRYRSGRDQFLSKVWGVDFKDRLKKKFKVKK